MAHDLDELSATTVEQVARRISRRHHRVGLTMLVFAVIGTGLVLLAAAELETLATIVGSALVLVGPPLYIHNQRRALRRHADHIADTAASRLDLDWTYRRGVIQGHDRTGANPRLALEAIPHQAEIDGGLPAAWIHR